MFEDAKQALGASGRPVDIAAGGGRPFPQQKAANGKTFVEHRFWIPDRCVAQVFGAGQAVEHILVRFVPWNTAIRRKLEREQ